MAGGGQENAEKTFESVTKDADVARKAKLHLALQIADAMTTMIILSKGGRELNPLLRLSPNNPEASVVIPKALGLMMGKRELDKMPIEDKEEAKKVLNMLNIFYLGLLANNVYQLMK
ncbi:MAG TPA: hypothetical protein ENI27_02420 [bacterium]|nr:hypothetical protein [bacterium]